jgi:hypothetical protein
MQGLEDGSRVGQLSSIMAFDAAGVDQGRTRHYFEP